MKCYESEDVFTVRMLENVRMTVERKEGVGINE